MVIDTPLAKDYDAIAELEIALAGAVRVASGCAESLVEFDRITGRLHDPLSSDLTQRHVSRAPSLAHDIFIVIVSPPMRT